MYSRLLIVAAALTVGVACDTNVRDVYASDAILSTDGERIATVRSRYEHYNNLVTEGTGPGSRDHEFSVYTWRTPDVSGIGASTMRSFPDGQGERFVYQGHLNGAQYVHNGTRRFIVGAYSNADRETRAGLLRIDADGRPRGGWRLIGDGAPVNIDISRDGALIAVATTVSTGEGRDAFAVKIYDGDSLAVVHTHQFSSGPESGGSVSGAWHKAPRGLDAATIGSEAFERLQMEKNLVHPASPGWPAQHDAVMEQVSTQRTLADFEWSYLAIARRWSNRLQVAGQLYTVRQGGAVERMAVEMDGVSPLDLHHHQGVYRASDDGLGFHKYAANGSAGESVVIYATVPEGQAFMNYVDWYEQTRTFDYVVRFGADYPYRAAFEVDRIDLVGRSVFGRIAAQRDNWEAVFPLDPTAFAAVSLHWTRDIDGFLRTCFIAARDEPALSDAEIADDDLEFGCDGAPWDNLSLEIGQDCEGTWAGHRTDTCAVDCAGVWGGDARLDGCGVCDADPANDNATCEADCAGVFDGGAEVENGACVEPTDMAIVPAGEFISGKPDDERSVNLPAFYMDRYEVTAGDYRRCVAAGACTYSGPTGDPEDHLGDWTEGRRNYRNGRDEHPMNFVTWSQAADYCGFVGKRLPTTLEWEKAARGTDGRTYPWGEAEPTCDLAVMYTHRDEGDGAGCGAGRTSPVGRKPAGRSPYGLYDMAGNVAEWTTFPHWGEEMRQYPMGGGLDGGGQSTFFAPNARLEEAYSVRGDQGFRCVR